MLAKPRLEKLIERNRLFASSDPVPAELAQEHFYLLIDFVRSTRRSVEISSKGMIVGRIEPLPNRREAA